MIDPVSKGAFKRQMKKAVEAGGFSEKATERFWDWAYSSEDGLVQVCAFPVPTESKDPDEMGNGKWIHTDSKQEFIEFCETYSNTWRYHVYSGVNTMNDEPEYGRGDTSNIENVNHLSFDIETVRDSYSGASKQEVWWCYKYALAQAKFMNEEYGVWPMIVMSENGIHMHYKVDFNVSKDMMNGQSHLYTKYMTQASMSSSYAKTIKSNAPDGVEFGQDDVSDIPRVMKVPGTRGIKSEKGRLCGIIHCPDKDKAGVITHDQLEVEPDVVEDECTDKGVADGGKQPVEVSPEEIDDELTQRVKNLCKRYPLFRKMFRGDESLYNGAGSTYESRSEAEYAFVLKMLNHAFGPEEINQVMWSSGMSKWEEEGQGYREYTIQNALERFDGNSVKDSTNGSFSFSIVEK